MRIGGDIDNVLSNFDETLLREYIKHDKKIRGNGIIKDGVYLREMFSWNKEYEEKFPNIIRIFSKENGGLGDTRNFGIPYAKGKYVIKVCDGTACHVRKSQPVKDAIMKELGLEGKKCTTDDMLFTVETVSCLGACGLAPTMMVNEDVHPKMTPDKAVKLIRELREENKA